MQQQQAADGRNTPRILPPALYDELQLSVEMYGGVGAGHYNVGETDVPLCIHGHGGKRMFTPPRAINLALVGLGINAEANDRAVSEINRRKGVTRTASWREPRVTWSEYCAELNVVRGAEEPSPRGELPNAVRPQEQSELAALVAQESR